VPRHDAAKDGNPFRWIVETAPKVRAQRQVRIDEHAHQRWLERTAARRPVAPQP
jgi:hypothetical protein